MTKQQIQQELREALLQKDVVKTATLRMLLAALLNKEKEKGEQLTEEQALALVQSEAKKRKESIDAYEKGGRPELAEKERTELAVLQAYLPSQMPEEDVRATVKEAIEQTEAASPQDMGKVMAAVMAKVKGKADGSLVSEIVKELLTK